MKFFHIHYHTTLFLLKKKCSRKNLTPNCIQDCHLRPHFKHATTPLVIKLWNGCSFYYFTTNRIESKVSLRIYSKIEWKLSLSTPALLTPLLPFLASIPCRSWRVSIPLRWTDQKHLFFCRSWLMVHSILLPRSACCCTDISSQPGLDSSEFLILCQSLYNHSSRRSPQDTVVCQSMGHR